jgi:hypothetical protein
MNNKSDLGKATIPVVEVLVKGKWISNSDYLISLQKKGGKNE